MVRSTDSKNLINRHARFLVLFYMFLNRTGTRLPEKFDISDEEMTDHCDKSSLEIGGTLMGPIERLVYENLSEEEKLDFETRVAKKRWLHTKRGPDGERHAAATLTATHRLTVNFPLMKEVNVFDPSASYVELTTDQLNDVLKGVSSLHGKTFVEPEDLLTLRLDFDGNKDTFAGMSCWLRRVSLLCLPLSKD